MTKIALLCPTRGRPAQCRRMTRSAAATSSTELKFWIGMQEDQRTLYANEQIQDFYIVPDWPTVMTWNLLAQEAMKFPENKLFMLAADDMIFATPGWDEALIEHYEALENKIHVYHLRDSRDENGTPHPCVTREYIETMGYFIPPIFMHWQADTWTVAIAKANNVFSHFKEFLLVHDKPSDKGQPDETHSRIRRMGWHSRDQYVNYTCQHFLDHEKKRLGEKLFSMRDDLQPHKIIVSALDVGRRKWSRR